MIRLRQPLTRAECEQIRLWRNSPDVYPMLRSGYLTEAQQTAFYQNVICNPEAPHWYYALERRRWWGGWQFIGVAGLTYLNRKPGEAEISLVLGPNFRGRGYGTAAVERLLRKAWASGISRVTGECYAASPARPFWEGLVRRWPPLELHHDTAGALHWTWKGPWR